MRNKKRWLALGMAAVMTAGIMTGCSSSGGSGDSDGGSDGGGEGSVYYLNFKPEQDPQWQDLAKAYTEETGVEVTVVTAASGEYETTLMSEMGKSGAPTLFQVNGPVGLANWKDYCYDLSDSDVYKELTSEGHALKDGDAVAGIAYVVESYGIIANTELLGEAGYTTEDIQSFEDLKKVSEDISSRSDELGFTAFTSAGMDGSSDWRFKTHLANLPIHFEYVDGGSAEAIKGTYLDNYREIWDLYINNSTCDPSELAAKTGDDSRNEFLNKEAVFFQNGSWEYGNLTEDGTFTDDSLAMIPIYFGVGEEAEQGLCTGTENFWCVNKEADEADIQATLDFMNWCVTSDLGTKTMGEDMGFVIPFKKAIESSNLFVKQDAEMTADGKVPVAWDFSTIPSEEWKNGVGSALTAYAADQTDDNWKAVENAFVDGWAEEYALAHQE